jgi:DNA-binding transcriptional ArsR family regulator
VAVLSTVISVKRHADLLELVGHLDHVPALAEGTGSLLASRPDPEQVIPLRGEVLAWAEHLAGEAVSGSRAAEIGSLRLMAGLLNGYIEAVEGSRPQATVRSQVLSHMADEGRWCRPSDIADALVKTRSQVSTALRSLVRDGLVEKDERSPRSDGRVALFRATEAGRAVVAAERPDPSVTVRAG